VTEEDDVNLKEN